jgi:zinc transport system substrate-binding protein
MRYSLRILLLLILTCTQADASPLIKIFVSTLPQQYFFEQIGADKIEVSVMVGPGQSPTTYDPTSKQIAELSSADLYQQIGVPFERIWMPDIARRIPGLKVVDAREGITLRSIEGTHDHASDHPESNEAKDPHIWTDPLLVKNIADQILRNLIELRPEHSATFTQNHRLFIESMDLLDENIRRILNGMENRRFMVFHPSWGYFADRYKLQQIPVELEGKSPGAKALAKLIETAQKNGIKTILVQKQFSQRSAKILAKSLGGNVVAVDPLAYNYPQNMEQVAKAIAAAATE